ncbi:putative membrane protein [Caulobacter ginsengisoli]|uniref:Membrane protein n=1 Tax=Caulobacter ginsengisoli TaxID=400775 RepID=A0ABU0IXR6_9CAUL|nr:DUF2339 domain-containing protein [Caulobacter ginsengisoli]MDQ0466795.1 putative membrane protein [Caulobacter ginsengisoli]
MIWLFTLGLAAWILRLSLDLNQHRSLTRRLSERLEALEDRQIPVAKPAAQAEPVEAPPPPTVGVLAEDRAPPGVLMQPEPEPPPRLVPPISPGRPPVDLVRLLSEKGLAWLGGGALVLGGLFLVGYAAQRGLFTPPVRLVSAVLGALAMLAASEWLRRPGPAQNSLVAAILAGAGAGGLYATVWAAWGLYRYLPGGPAVLLMTGVSTLLLGLSLRHRQPLALLALLGAFAAPEIAGRGIWSEEALTLHLLLVVVAGFAVAVGQRWSWTALATVLGVAGVCLLDAGVISPTREIALNLVTPVLALAYAGLNAHRGPARPFGLIAPLALGLSAFSLMLFWVAHAALWLAPVALAALAPLAGLAIGRTWTRWEALIAPVVLAVLGLTIAVGMAFEAELMTVRLEGAGLAIALVAAGLFARRQPLAVVSAAAGALLLMLRGAYGLDPLPAALALEAGAAVLILAAWPQARHTPNVFGDPAGDLALGAWSLAAGLALVAAIRLGARPEAVPALEAALALGVILLQRRLAWRGLAAAALAAGGAAVAASLDPRFIGPALASANGAGLAVLACALAATLLAVSSRLPRLPQDQTAPRQSLAAGAVILALIGAFIGLRWCASGQGLGLSLLLEASLRTLLMSLAGAALLLVTRDRRGTIARLGPHALLLLAAVHGVLCQLLIWNPLWGIWREPIETLPLLGSLALAYLASAGAFALAASRTREPVPARIYGTLAALFGLTWALLTLRHTFHGPDLTAGISPFAERIAQAALLPLLALGLDWIDRRGRLVRATQAVRWLGLTLALTITGLIAFPWWGADPAPMGGLGLGLLALALLAGLAAITWASGRIERDRAPILGETALVLAAGQALLPVTLAVRWAFHPHDPAHGAGLPLETWAYSAVWAVGGAALLALGSGLKERALRWTGLLVLLATAAKVAFFDTANLEGVARAGSFLAVGVLMVAAAVISRRLTRVS